MSRPGSILYGPLVVWGSVGGIALLAAVRVAAAVLISVGVIAPILVNSYLDRTDT